jgi:CBS domain-containing protein
MLVKELMTMSPIRCEPSDRVDRVAALMAENDCGAIPVCKGAKVVGLITDRDITCRVVAKRIAPGALAVEDVMTRNVHTIREDAEVESAIDLMEQKQVRRLPVVDEHGDMVGIVAPSDLAPTFASSNIADFLLAVSYWRRRAAVSP